MEMSEEKKVRHVFFDIETTGLKQRDGHRVVEVAALEYVDKVPTGRKVHLYFNPERDVPMEVVRIHGLDNEFLRDKPLFKDTIHELEAFMHGAEVLAHNGDNFDFSFMDSELLSNGMKPMSEWGIVKFTDTLKMARAVARSKKNTLDALCDLFHVDRTSRDLHGAVIDCRLLADVWYKMTAHIDFNKPDASARQEPIVRLVNLPELKVVRASASDEAEHTAYINNWMESEPKADILFSKENRASGMKP